MNAIDILKRFDTFLNKVELATMKLANGTVLEADEFSEGHSVFIISDTDEQVPLPVGEYELEDGRVLTVGEVGKIGKMDLETVPEAEEEGYKDGIKDAKEDIKKDVEDTKLAEDEAVVEDWAGMEKRIKNLEDAIADLKKDKVSVKAGDDNSPQDPEEFEGGYVSKEEFQSEVKEMKNMIEKIEAKLNEGKEEDGAFVVKEELGSQLLKHNPNSTKSTMKFKLGANKPFSTMDKIMERISNINHN